MESETNISQVVDITADKAKYDNLDKVQGVIIRLNIETKRNCVLIVISY